LRLYKVANNCCFHALSPFTARERQQLTLKKSIKKAEGISPPANLDCADIFGITTQKKTASIFFNMKAVYIYLFYFSAQLPTLILYHISSPKLVRILSVLCREKVGILSGYFYYVNIVVLYANLRVNLIKRKS